MNKCTVIIFAIITCFTSCEKQTLEKPWREIIELTGKRWHVEKSLGRAFSINSSDYYLIVTNDIGKTHLTGFTYDSEHRVVNFAQHGTGPLEFKSAKVIPPSTSIIEAYSIMSSQIIGFKLDSLFYHTGPHAYKAAGIPIVPIISMCKISDDLYLATGLFKDGRFAFIKDGKVTSHTGSFDDLNVQHKSLPANVLSIAFQGNMFKPKHHNRFALAGRYGDFIEIYEVDTTHQSLKEIKSTLYEEPVFAIRDIHGSPNFSPNRETKWAYITVTGDESYFYALYSGKIQALDKNFSSGSEIHVYDWSGLPIACLKLTDYHAKSVAVFEGKLYTLVEDEDFGYDIVEYDSPFS